MDLRLDTFRQAVLDCFVNADDHTPVPMIICRVESIIEDFCILFTDVHVAVEALRKEGPGVFRAETWEPKAVIRGVSPPCSGEPSPDE